MKPALYLDWSWPEGEVFCRRVIFRDLEESLPRILAATPGRRCVVQAGGNVGVVPTALAEHFDETITFEPDPENLRHLLRNTAGVEGLEVHPFALGDRHGHCRMVEVEPHNCGAHRIDPSADGDILVRSIDALKLEACDLIWLDIEGFELAALMGAEQTIERLSPVVCIEDKGLSETYGVALGQAGQWLAARGYQQVDAFGRDKLYRRTTLAPGS